MKITARVENREGEHQVSLSTNDNTHPLGIAQVNGHGLER